MFEEQTLLKYTYQQLYAITFCEETYNCWLDLNPMMVGLCESQRYSLLHILKVICNCLLCEASEITRRS